ncbi:MAG TPA: heavy metal-responsive transcriptional regulator [Acidobacteriaceae bacterium]|nr:heavy metal-responsive transcriptional regulator [Acidobacteriaceae bacterium]
MEPLTMGRMAKRAEVNPQTIRYYEREGLIEAEARLSSGYRLFSEDSVQRVRFIKRTQKLGFSLDEIKELLSMRQKRTGREVAAVKRLAAAKIAEIDRKIQALTSMRSTLKQLEEACPGRGPLSGCPIVKSLQFEEEISTPPTNRKFQEKCHAGSK